MCTFARLVPHFFSVATSILKGWVRSIERIHHDVVMSTAFRKLGVTTEVHSAEGQQTVPFIIAAIYSVVHRV